METKYSIVIPTRNGAHYLKYAIESVLENSRSDVELIVSNNHSSDGTDQILAQISDSRLKVVRPEVALPMAGHYEFALSHAKGEWITILGDDDAVMPYIFERLDRHINENPEVEIISSVRAYYFWNGCKDLFGDRVVSYSSTSKSEVRSTKMDLVLALSGFRSCFDIPQIYTTGIVKRSLIDEIKKRSGGCLYHSIIPDMYSAVALCLARSSYLRLSEPIFWVGTSNKSMSRSNRIYRDSELFDAEHAELYPCVPRRISDSVSFKLHSSAFGSTYIYECVLQSPLRSKSFESSLLRRVVLASVTNDARRRQREERIALRDVIRDECIRYKIPCYQVKALADLLRMVNFMGYLIKLPGRVIRRLGATPTPVQFKSSDRDRFSTILEASAAVSELRSKDSIGH